MAARTKPFIALILSSIIPGLGQSYNHEPKKALAVFGSCLALGLIAYWISGLNQIAAALAVVILWLSAALDAYQVAKSAGQAPEFYYSKAYVVAMLLLVGPLALPLLWQSPNFSRRSRYGWTALIVAAALLFFVTPYLLKGLMG